MIAAMYTVVGRKTIPHRLLFPPASPSAASCFFPCSHPAINSLVALKDWAVPGVAPGIHLSSLKKQILLEFPKRNAVFRSPGQCSGPQSGASANVERQSGWQTLRDGRRTVCFLIPFAGAKSLSLDGRRPPLLNAAEDWFLSVSCERSFPWSLGLLPIPHIPKIRLGLGSARPVPQSLDLGFSCVAGFAQS